MNRGDAPEWKRAARPQAIGELIGEEIAGPSAYHGRRKYFTGLLRPQLDRGVPPAQHAGSPRRQTVQEREIGGLLLDGSHKRGTDHDGDPELARERLEPAGDVGGVAHGR